MVRLQAEAAEPRRAVVVAHPQAEAAVHLQGAALVAVAVPAVRVDLVAAAVAAPVAVVAAARLPVAVELPQAVAVELLPLVSPSLRLALCCSWASRLAMPCAASARRDNLVAVKSAFY